MSVATSRTKLSLDEWAFILGINPLHFNQVVTTAMPNFLCTNVWKQFAWQDNGMVSREDIAMAIAQAENDMEGYLYYPLAPIWINDEHVKATQPGNPTLMNVALQDTRGLALPVKLRNGFFISGGLEAKEVIEAGAIVVFSDEDGDGYEETATVTVVTTVTDPEEIAIYYPGEAANDDWEVRPLHSPRTHRRDVTIAGGTATIVFAKAQIVDPDLLNAFNPVAVDGDVAANFLANVDVYRHFNDPQTQVTLMWAPFAGGCNCSLSTCQTCAHTVQTGCLLAHDYRSGIVRFSPANWNDTTERFDSRSPSVGRNPDNLRAFYRAGWEDLSPNAVAPKLEMELALARAVTFLSLRYLARPVCGCDNVKELTRRMTMDLAAEIATGDSSQAFKMSDRQLDNPLGTERGALLAWQTILQGDRRLGMAVLL